MSVDCFLKLTDLEGESLVKGHEKEIDVLQWGWSMSQSGASHLGGGAGTGRVQVQDLSFTKYVDGASTGIWKACAQLTHIPEAILTCRKAGGDDPLDYYKLTLSEVIVTSVATGTSMGDDRQTENVTLSFKTSLLEYTPQDDKGAGGAAKTFEYDIAANVVS